MGRGIQSCVCVCAVCMHGLAHVAKAKSGEEILSVIFNLLNLKVLYVTQIEIFN